MGIDAEMFVRLKRPVSDEEVFSVAKRLAEAFGPERFGILRQDTSWMKAHHALARITEWEQDGPTLAPEDGETFVRAHLRTRYYGAGYERGDLPFLLAVRRFLLSAWPDGEVWYGGDSSGVCAEPLDDAAESALWAHFVEHGHRPYQLGFGLGVERVECPFCREPTANTGGGMGVSFHYCGCCGWEVVRHSDGRLQPRKEWNKETGSKLPGLSG